MLNHSKFDLPKQVLNKLSYHADIQSIIDSLQTKINVLEQREHIEIKRSIAGGTSAFVALATTKQQEEVIIKIPLQEIDTGAEFANEIEALKIAKGRSYVDLLAFDSKLNIAFLEPLGVALGALNFSTKKQIEIICKTLENSWIKRSEGKKLPNTLDLLNWFSDYIHSTWLALEQPFSKDLLARVNKVIAQRRASFSIINTCLVHGDAHNFNILQTRNGNSEQFKLIDPDGMWSEPAYDLGVLMREWVDELLLEPTQALKDRLSLLNDLTGVEKKAISQWGLLQTVATALVLRASNQMEESDKLLTLANLWEQID